MFLNLNVKTVDLDHDVYLVPGPFASVGCDFDSHSKWCGEDEEGSVIHYLLQ